MTSEELFYVDLGMKSGKTLSADRLTRAEVDKLRAAVAAGTEVQEVMLRSGAMAFVQMSEVESLTIDPKDF